MTQTTLHWWDLTHWDITDIAALRMGLTKSQRESLRQNVLVPDSWGIIDKIRHYMPLCSYFAGELTREAMREVGSSGRDPKSFEKLGQAMHFLQDAGNPWHAQPLLPFFQRNHRSYEEYVAKNMREGFCFRDILLETTTPWTPHSRFIQRIGDGAAHLARNAIKEYSFLDKCICTDPNWQENENVAEVTLSILIPCLRMCEIQIHSFKIRAENRESWSLHLPVAVTWTFLGPDSRRLPRTL